MRARGQEDATNSENTKHWKATVIRSEEGARNQWNVRGHEGTKEQCDARAHEGVSNSEGSRGSDGAGLVKSADSPIISGPGMVLQG